MRPPSKTLPPVHGLLAFEAAARHLSFTQAAKELGATQPAISHQVRRLEEHLGVPLFQRIYRGVTLTAEGRQLFDAVQKGFGLVTDAVGRIQGPRHHVPVNVATDFGFAAFWLLPRLPAFRSRHPDIDVRIVTAQKAFDLRTDPVDVAVVFGTGSQRHCTATRLFAETVYPVCSPRYLEGRSAIGSAPDLLGEPLLHLDDEGDERWFTWRSWLSAAGVEGAPRGPLLSFNTYTLLIQAAIAGQGIALGWAPLVDPLIRMGQLARVLDLTFSTDRGYFALLPTDRAPRPESLAFHEWLLAQPAEGALPATRSGP